MPIPGALAFAAAGAPVLGDIFKGIMGNQSANRDRALERMKLGEAAKNAKFQRLLQLANQSQGMQGQLSGAERLLSLRNAGGL